MTPQQVKASMHADSSVDNTDNINSANTNKVNNSNQNNNVKNNQATNQVADQYNQTYQNEKQQYQAAQSGQPAPVSGNQNSSISQPTVAKPQTKAVSQNNAQNSNTANTTNVTQAATTSSNNLPGPNQVKIGTTASQNKQIAYNNVSDAPSVPFHHYDDLTDTSFTTDKAVYNPGDTVHTSITLKNTANFNQWGTYKLNVFNPTTQATTVASGEWKVDQGQSQTLNLDWTTPKIDDQGYVMDLQLFTSTGDLLDEFTNAVDVDTDPYKHPRYGALTDFSGGDIAKEKAMVDSLAKNYHLNMQMLYDCYFEPQDPLPNQAQWKDWHGDEISKQAIQDIVNQIHQDGGKAFLYDMIGATSDKSMPQTGFYDPNTGDWLNANLGNGNYQYYHDIANANWQKFIIPAVIKQAQAMGFDGWQGDTPGSLNGNSYNQRKDKAHAFNDSDFYHYFASAVMNYIKQNDPKFAFGMNSVNAAGQTAIAKDSGDTFDYSELWPDAYPTYGDIAKVIEQNWQNDGKPLVVPAYLYNQWRDAETNGKVNDLPKTYNDNAVRQLIATIMANGGSPMVLADGGYLIDDQYYPWMRMENGKQINMSPALGDPTNGEMKHYFDFDTGYENILQDPAMKSNNNYIQVWNGGGVNQGQCINKNDAEANTVYAFSKSNGTIDTLNLVNLMGSTNKWQVYNTNDNDSHNVQEQKNLWIKYYPSEQDQNIKHIYVSSPDSYYEGKRIEVPFKEMVDPSGHKYVEFEVPDLQIWDLVYMTTQDPQNTIDTPTSYQGNQGANLVQPSAGNSIVNEKDYPWLNQLHPTDKNIIGKGTAGGNVYRVADQNYVPNDAQMVFYLPWMTTAQNNAGGSATVTLTSGNDKITFTAVPNNDQTTTITIDHNGQVSTYKSYFNIEQGTGAPVKAGSEDPGDFLPLEIHTSQNSVSFWINDTLNKPTEVYTVKRDPDEQTQHVTVDVNGIYDGVGGEDDGSVDENYTMSIWTKPSPYDKRTFTDTTDNHPSTPEVIYGPIPKATDNKPAQGGSTPTTKPSGGSSGESSSSNKPSSTTDKGSSTNDKPAQSGSSNSKPSGGSSSKPAQSGSGSSTGSSMTKPQGGSTKPTTPSGTTPNKPSQGSPAEKPSSTQPSQSGSVNKPAQGGSSQGSQPAVKPTTPSNSSQSKPSGSTSATPNKPSGSTSSGSTTTAGKNGQPSSQPVTKPSTSGDSTPVAQPSGKPSQGSPAEKPSPTQPSQSGSSQSKPSATPSKPSGSSSSGNQSDQSGSTSSSTPTTPVKPSASGSSESGTPSGSATSSSSNEPASTPAATPVSGNTKPTMSSTSASSSATPSSSTNSNASNDNTNSATSVKTQSTPTSSQSMTSSNATEAAQGSATTSDNTVKPLTPHITAPSGDTTFTTSDGSPVSGLDVSPQSSRSSGASSADHSEQNSINASASGLEDNFDVQSHTNQGESHSTDLVADGTSASLAQTGETNNTSWLASLLSALGLGALLKHKCD